MMKRMQSGDGHRRHRERGGRNRPHNGGNNNGRSFYNSASKSDPQHDRRTRAKALQFIDKYTQMAKDAFSNGDGVLAEYYYQHADHYYRVAASFGDMPVLSEGNEGGEQPDQGIVLSTDERDEEPRVQQQTEQREKEYRQPRPSAAEAPADYQPRDNQERRPPRENRDNQERSRFRPREEGRNNRDNNHREANRPLRAERPFQPRPIEQPSVDKSAEKIDAAFLFGSVPPLVPAAIIAEPIAVDAVVPKKRAVRKPRVVAVKE